MRKTPRHLRFTLRLLQAFAVLLAVLVATGSAQAGVMLPADLAGETVETAAGAMSSPTESPAQPADVPAGDEPVFAQPPVERPLEGGSGTMGTTGGTGGAPVVSVWFAATASATSLDQSGGVLEQANTTIPAPPTFNLLRPPRHA